MGRSVFFFVFVLFFIFDVQFCVFLLCFDVQPPLPRAVRLRGDRNVVDRQVEISKKVKSLHYGTVDK